MKIRFLLPIVIAAARLLAADPATSSVTAPVQTFFVSPSGTDESPGTATQPWRTIEHARDMIRGATAAGLGDVEVELMGGEYNLTSTLIFEARDGGRSGHTVSYRAAEGQHPVVSGGRRIGGWTSVEGGNLWKAPVGNLDFRQLYVNGHRGVRARTPNRTNDANMGPFSRVVSWGQSNLVVKVVDLAAMKNFDGVEVVVNSHWHHKRLRIESVKVEGDLATITPKPPERTADFFGHFANANDPFYLENAIEFLEMPGEWFLDSKAHVVYYRPRPGEDMKTAEVIAPALETLIKIQGTVASPVTGLKFKGIQFEHSTWLTPSREGLVDNQSMVEEGGWGWLNGPASTRPNPGAVELHNASGITLEGCSFEHLGCHGVTLVAPSARNRIVGNRFSDISAGAIVVNPTTDREGTPSDHDTITDNIITRCGQDYTSACGIIATYASFLTIEHNELSDLPYTGISIGWGWGATPNTKSLHDNSIRFNHIHHVMQCHDDGAGIYTLERQNGTVVSENYVHDIGRSPWAGDYVNAGIYFDNGSSFITAERNVVENVFDDQFIKVQDQPKADTTHDLTLRENDIHDQAIKANAGPRSPKDDGHAELTPRGLPLREVVSTKMELPLQVAPGLVLHVAQSGNDGGDGSAEKPFASLERARDEIRAIRKNSGMPKGGVTVLVHRGEYAVSKTFTLTAEDSGNEDAPVRYCAAPGEKAAFQGGARLEGWKQLNDTNLYPLLPRESIGKVWCVDMKSVGITNPMALKGDSPAHELFFNDKAMQLARGPNSGFLHIAGVAMTNLDHGPGAYDTRPSSREGVFTYNTGLPDKWAAEPDLWLYGYWFWGWSEAYQRVESVDTNKRIIKLAKPWHENGFSVDAPFYAYNALSELDAPGEWYMDRVNGRVLFYPPSDIEKGAVHLSTFTSALVKMEDVSNVRFEGLTWEFGSGDAIHVNGGSNCLFAGCAIRNCAGNAIDIKGGSKHGVLSCDIYSMGGRGIWLEGGDRKTLVPGGHYAENCDIHDLSRISHTYTPAVWLEGVGNLARHNRLHDIASSAIRLGGNDHIIEYNEIYNVVTESDDQGGIDMWNDATYQGNIFRYNYWHHIGNWKGTGEVPRCGQCAIRVDDGICGTLIQGNIFERCAAGKIIGFGAVQINGGKDHVIENNLFVDCMAMISESAWDSGRWQEYARSTLDRMSSRDLYFEKYPAMKILAEGANLNYVRNNRAIRCGEQFRAHYGAVLNNLKATNNITLPVETEFIPQSDNPLFTQPGFERIPIQEMGVYADVWRKMKEDGVAEQHQQIGIKTQESAQSFRRNDHPDAQWFPHAGLGLFIHWGISSVDGRIDLSWGMMTNTPWDKGAFKLTPNQYFALADRFQPDHYDPRKWLSAAKNAGFQYVVLTTRHHDGYALWPSKVSDFSTATHMQSRDLVKDYVDACREAGLKVGFYYSPPDWHYNRDWMAFNWREDQDPYLGLDHQPMTEPKRSPEEIKASDLKYKGYIRSQVEELLTRYGRIDVLWFDGGPEAISFERIRELQPGIVVNPRMHGYGDFTTDEVGFPKTRPQPWWEMCSIWNGAWGYLKNEKYNSTAWMLQQFSEVRSWGGNYLINIGPRPNGELPDVAYERFHELGGWMKTNSVAVLDVEGGLWPDRCNVPVTSKARHFYLLVPPRFQEVIVFKQAPEPRKLALLGSSDVIEATYEDQVLSFGLKSTQQSGLVDVVDLEW